MKTYIRRHMGFWHLLAGIPNRVFAGVLIALLIVVPPVLADGGDQVFKDQLKVEVEESTNDLVAEYSVKEKAFRQTNSDLILAISLEKNPAKKQALQGEKEKNTADWRAEKYKADRAILLKKKDVLYDFYIRESAKKFESEGKAGYQEVRDFYETEMKKLIAIEEGIPVDPAVAAMAKREAERRRRLLDKGNRNLVAKFELPADTVGGKNSGVELMDGRDHVICIKGSFVYKIDDPTKPVADARFYEKVGESGKKTITRDEKAVKVNGQPLSEVLAADWDNHYYEFVVVGNGKTISIEVTDFPDDNEKGDMEVEIYRIDS